MAWLTRDWTKQSASCVTDTTCFTRADPKLICRHSDDSSDKDSCDNHKKKDKDSSDHRKKGDKHHKKGGKHRKKGAKDSFDNLSNDRKHPPIEGPIPFAKSLCVPIFFSSGRGISFLLETVALTDEYHLVGR